MTENSAQRIRNSCPGVSVIIPSRNDAMNITNSLDSIFAQDYTGSMEVIVADGSDTSATATMVHRHYPSVRVVPNPEKLTGFGANAALRAASGEVIVRCDSHTRFPPEYVRRAVATLMRTGAANVGGRQQPVGTTFFERAVALAMTTPLGAGNARYRLGGTEGAVDTVFLGTFQRKALEAVGGYDGALVRNQDYELNWRLRQHGETVWFDPQLVAYYRPRGTLRKLARQYFDYGRWKRVVLRQHPTSVRARHLAAPLLVSGLAAAGLLGLVGVPWKVVAATPLAYLVALATGALAVGISHREKAAVLLPLVLVTMHLCWGIGFFLPPRK